MKKLFKCIFGAVSVAAVAGGVFLLMKKLTQKDTCDSCDDSQNDLEEEESDVQETENREYVSIKITTEPSEESKVSVDAQPTEAEPNTDEPVKETPTDEPSDEPIKETSVDSTEETKEEE